MRRAVVLGLALLLSLATLAQRPKPADPAPEANAVKQADADWARACAAKDIEQFMSFIDPNARLWQGGQGVHGAAIREEFRQSFGDKDFALNWTPVDATVAASGDIAYSTGTYTLAAHDASGQLVHRSGSYLTVWKKNANGEWKVIEDIGSTTPPKPASPPDQHKDQ
jgi:ketosteroid isomerase-like protein